MEKCTNSTQVFNHLSRLRRVMISRLKTAEKRTDAQSILIMTRTNENGRKRTTIAYASDSVAPDVINRMQQLLNLKDLAKVIAKGRKFSKQLEKCDGPTPKKQKTKNVE